MHKFLIAENSGEDAILGIDFLQLNNCVIDIANQKLKFQKSKSHTKLINVFLATTTNIPAKTTKHISVIFDKLSNSVNFNNLIIEGNSFNR